MEEGDEGEEQLGAAVAPADKMGGGAGGEEDTGGRVAGKAARTPQWRLNSMGKHRYFACGSDDHWASECPHITDEQQAQLHMMQELDMGDYDEGEEAAQYFQKFETKVVYLDSCTMSSTFVVVGEDNSTNVKCVKGGLKYHPMQHGKGKDDLDWRGDFGRLKVWAMKDGIVNTLSLGEMIKVCRVTFNSLDGYFSVHTPEREVHFVLDEHEMPAFHLVEDKEAAKNVIQAAQKNYEGYCMYLIK